jgi:membrane fusion protein (multidrug efflux system)
LETLNMNGPSDDSSDSSRDSSALVEVMPTEQKVSSPDDKDDDSKKGGDGKSKEGDDKSKDDKEKSSAKPSPEPPKKHHPLRIVIIAVVVVISLGIALFFMVPWVVTQFNTVSTDDAYVNGHVTMVAPRVAGQVSLVLVDDNRRVKKGDILVTLDKEPYLVQLKIKEAAVKLAETDLTAAQAQVRGLLALARSQRWQLQTAMDQVASQVANLKATYATYKSKVATLELAKSNFKRGVELQKTGGISKEELDQRQQTVKVDEADVEQALQSVHAARVALGLPDIPNDSPELIKVPPQIEQTFPGVRTTLANLVQTAAQIGLPLPSAKATPQEVLEEFQKRDVTGNIDRIVEQLIPDSPPVQQAEAKLLQAKSDLAQAKLNLRYCDIVSEIDGIVTRRNVNPGNNVQVGQSLMAVRSLTEIWIDANFKETQLGDLRIGQRVRCVVDMYGSKREFEGRITGFTMGTGQTLSLLPPENATGNFVKIVQRLPVRVELTNYEPDKDPLFAGLSVVPYVYYKEAAAGPNAGAFLQPYAILPQGATEPKP